MIFGKKKDMVELSEVQRRSVNLPHGKSFVPKDGYGFVDLTRSPRKSLPLRATQKVSTTSSEPASTPFSFFDTPTSSSQVTPYEPESNESSKELKELIRKVSMQVSDLDSKLYKMEQRIELLEKKTGIDNSSNTSTGGFSW